MDSVDIRQFKPTDKDWLVQQHGILYAQSEGFDDTFGVLVDQILTAFLADHDPAVDSGWIATKGDQRLGSIFCVRLDETTAKLRLFLITPDARGTGLGRALLKTCMDHAKACGYSGMQLWTHESHKAACALYRKNGWHCVDSRPVRSFGVDLVEQTWKISF